MIRTSALMHIQDMTFSKERLVKEFRLLRGSMSLYYTKLYLMGVMAVGI